MSTKKEGYNLIDITLTDDVKNTLINGWVVDKLSPPSQETFVAEFTKGMPIEDALYAGILNDIIIDVIQKKINETKEKSTENDK